jgi:hypothetical protein
MHESHLIFVKPLELYCYMTDNNSINCISVPRFSVKHLFIIFLIDLFRLYKYILYIEYFVTLSSFSCFSYKHRYVSEIAFISVFKCRRYEHIVCLLAN